MICPSSVSFVIPNRKTQSQDNSPSPISHNTLSSSVSTIKEGTFLALCVLESLQTIANRPNINVSHPSPVDPDIFTTTSILELPVHVTNPENRRSLLKSVWQEWWNRGNGPDEVPVERAKHVETVCTGCC